MKFTELDWTPEILGKSGLPRSKGLHLSDILDELAVAMKQNYTGPGFKNQRDTFEGGYTWEEMTEMAFAKRMAGVERPPEVSVDGVAMSPDGMDRKVNILYEYKATWKSARTFELEKQWRYLTQIKCYAWALKVKRVRLLVFFIMGAYNGEGPLHKAFDIKFTRFELYEHWKMVREFAQDTGLL